MSRRIFVVIKHEERPLTGRAGAKRRRCTRLHSGRAIVPVTRGAATRAGPQGTGEMLSFLRRQGGVCESAGRYLRCACLQTTGELGCRANRDAAADGRPATILASWSFNDRRAAGWAISPVSTCSINMLTV